MKSIAIFLISLVIFYVSAYPNGSPVCSITEKEMKAKMGGKNSELGYKLKGPSKVKRGETIVLELEGKSKLQGILAWTNAGQLPLPNNKVKYPACDAGKRQSFTQKDYLKLKGPFKFYWTVPRQRGVATINVLAVDTFTKWQIVKPLVIKIE
ncbi:hypothetical protein O9G_002437 [Rozella allomycis CSF55]|uniref:Reelin domain-containing protein n=1 Tax=Rozella allomycis (strain CSF55) TaxID=988480 RepID=A0A075AXG6_ROZAC|nr:hypothetical protein O9G_002437 [Rozella allomycis CSF55]|eukprot:EPZ34839.1 hypothetical protein O9G_002437 [Rozella allomycis CSF55]